MNPKITSVTGLYLQGIRDGRPREAVEAFTGARYSQHSTGVPDGKAGFVTFFESFIEQHPKRDIRVVRALGDGFVRVPPRLPGPRRGQIALNHARLPRDR